MKNGRADYEWYVRTGGAWQPVEITIQPSTFFSPGTNVTINPSMWVRRRGNLVRGEFVLNTTMDFTLGLWLGNVAPAYLPIADIPTRDLVIRVSQGGGSAIGMAALSRSDRALRGYIASASNRRCSIDFEWPITP